MNKKQTLRWFHRNVRLSLAGVYSITRLGKTISGNDCNALRSDFLSLVAQENAAKLKAA